MESPLEGSIQMNHLNRRALGLVASIFNRELRAQAQGLMPMQCRPEQIEHLSLALECLGEIASGLRYLHARGFVHGDIKSQNMLLMRDPRQQKGFILKMADFGFSRAVDHGSHTYLSRPAGTLAYLAPELLTQCRQSSAADVYSFGLLVYECVTTTAPFKGLLPAQILFSKTSNADWKHLVWPGWVPARVQELAMRCADQNPGNRYTAAQAREELVLLTQLHSGPSSSGLPQPPPPPAVAVV